ncbi:MAG: hypothetical protein WD404_10305 [Solirubrobacterales bacterium]
MIREARNYLAGALSGTALIAVAVVAFVLLVSLQAARDWPLAGIFGGGDDAPQSAAGTDSPSAGGDGAGGAADASAAGGQGGGDGGAAGGGEVDGGSPGSGAPGSGTPGSTPAGNGDAGSGGSPGSSGSASGGAKGAGGGSSQSSGGGGSSPSGTVANAVNDTVSGVDAATGGALGQTGVTKVTEGVVNGVAGPESTVDEVGKSVEGLLGGGD